MVKLPNENAIVNISTHSNGIQSLLPPVVLF